MAILSFLKTRLVQFGKRGNGLECWNVSAGVNICIISYYCARLQRFILIIIINLLIFFCESKLLRIVAKNILVLVWII